VDNPEKPPTLSTRDTRRRQTKQEHNTLCSRHHYAQANTSNVNNKWTIIQTTGDKDEPNIVSCGNRNGHHNTELRM